jgi:MtN3 and saliva related transmembrane protein
MIFNALQLIGGIVLSFGYIPQILQIIKTESVRDLNIKTNSMVLIGISLMEIYAINLFNSGSGGMYLVTNTIALIFALIMVVLICIYRK